MVTGTCLENQIYHLLEEDLKRLNQGLNSIYLIKSYGSGFGFLTY